MKRADNKIAVAVTGTLGFDYIMDFPGEFADRIMPDKIHKIRSQQIRQKSTHFIGIIR